MKTAGQTISTAGQRLVRLLCLAAVAALSVPAFAQTLPARWRWSNPTPHGGNVFDMAYGLGVTIQVAERGQIYTSDDLVYWQPRESGTTKSLRGVTFQGDRALITGEAGTVLYADSLDDFQLVDLGTTDWLESVAASASKVVAVGDNAAIYVSSDSGVTWEQQTLDGNPGNWLRGVATDGNSFVAVGEGGFIATANNPSNWTIRNSGTTTNLNRVAFLNGKFWIVGDGGVVLQNGSNLNTWQAVLSDATNALYSAAGTNTAAALLVGDKEVRLTENGSTWSSETDAGKTLPAAAWTYYSGLWEGSLYLIAGRSGMIYEGFSTNGAETLWVRRHDPVRTWLWDVARTPNFYVAVGDYATIMTSERGVTWNLELVPDAATNSILLGVGGATNGLVAVGSGGTILFSPNEITNVVLTNLDLSTVTNSVSAVGTIWTAVPRPVTNDLQGVAWLNNLFVVSGSGGTILTSTDGTNWTKHSTLVNAFLSSVEAFPGGWVATGDQGTILTGSLNGLLWIPQLSGTTNWIYRVRYLNGQLIAVGENGTILTSSTGIDWTQRDSGTTRWLTDVEFTANTWFVSGAQGTVLASADLMTWTNAGTITQKSLYGLASHNGQLLTVGVEGAILRAQLTAIEEPFRFIDFGFADGMNLFSVSGQVDQRITFDSTTNLVDWVEGITLEILDPSGTLLFLENANTNTVTREFFRGRATQ